MAYTAEQESMSMNASFNQITVRRVFNITPGSAWLEAVKYLLGGFRIIGGKMIRVPGRADPELPQCFVESVDVEGLGTFTTGTSASGSVHFTTAPAYTRQRLTVTYTTYIPDDIDLLTESYDMSAQMLTVPNEWYGFLGTGTLGSSTVTPMKNIAPEMGAQKIVPEIKYTLSRCASMTVPITAIRQLLGSVNKQALTLNIVTGASLAAQDDSTATIDYAKAIRTYPAETLRFDGAGISRRVSLYGAHFYSMDLHFSWQTKYDKIETGSKASVGWNRIYNPSTDRYERLAVAPSTDRQIHRYDEDAADDQTIKGKTVTGMRLLFDLGAT